MPGFLRWLATPVGAVPVISTGLRTADLLGGWKARWGIGRMSYLVPPGLYAIGEPNAGAPVVVTANYKMSYDVVRRALAGRSVWLLVLETYGINVWCAAGKGTFGTGELVRRIQQSRLAEVVEHRRLVLPLLGAAGVRALEVGQRTGFGVAFASIRAEDLPGYLDNGMVTSDSMRRLTFTLRERLVLVPVELVSAAKGSLPIVAALACIGGAAGGWTLPSLLLPLAAYLGAVFAGTVAAPLLLPWLPTRSFSIKGAFCGLLWTGFFRLLAGDGWRWHETALAFLALPTVAAFLFLNFTGSTPYTSRSGVKKEMRLSLPVMAGALLVGAGCWLAGTLIGR